MTNPKVYEKTLVELGNLLGKLLKVIRHPDPTAEQKKKQLLDKYHLNMRLFGEKIQTNWSWTAANQILSRISEMDGFTVEFSEHKVVVDRLKKDLGPYLIPKANFPEFEPVPLKEKPLVQSPSNPSFEISKAQSTPPLKFDASSNTKPSKPIQDAEVLMKIATMNPKEKEATNDLQRMIDAINKIGPDALENRIQTVYKKIKQ